MSHTKIISGQKAREQMLIGVNIVADAVKVTLGPQGRHVTIQPNPGDVPTITKDGATVAGNIRSLEDPFQDIGAQIIKQAALHTAGVAGDGTTTATMLAQGFMVAGSKAIEEGNSPIDIIRGMEEAVSQFNTLLKKVATPVKGDADILKAVATISSNNDAVMGELVAKAIIAVGEDGMISWADSQTDETYFVKSNGVEIEDKGFKDVRFINNTKHSRVDFDNALIMLYPKKLSLLREIETAITIAILQKRPLLIISDDIDNEAFATVILNRQGGFPICTIKLPGYGSNQSDFLQDIAIATGATIISADNGIEPKYMTLEHMGTADKIIVTRDKTSLLGVGGSVEDIQVRAEQIRNFLKSTESGPYEKKTLEKRLACLLGSTAIIRVGGVTDMERGEKKYRIEDALRATRAAMEEGVVVGGGTTQFKISNKLNFFGNQLELVGFNIVRNVLRSIMTQIITNAGGDAPPLCNEILELSQNTGYNAKTGKVVDLFAAGVLDPAKVLRMALANALSVAKVFLTTEASMIEVQ